MVAEKCVLGGQQIKKKKIVKHSNAVEEIANECTMNFKKFPSVEDLKDEDYIFKEIGEQ